MSLSGTTNTYLPPTLDGLNIIDADAIYINGIPIDTENLVPYTNATKNINLGTFNFQTLGSVSAKEHLFPSFGSTMMTGAMTSSIFYADAWSMNNTLAISSLGGGSFVSTSYLRMTDGSNNSTLLTLQSDGIADFANTKVRVSTMATSAYDVVNLSTLTSAVAFIENVNALNYVPYTGATDNLNMGGSTITTSGLMNAGALRITSSISNVDYSVSVNGTDFLEFTNLLSNQKVYTDGDSVWIPNRLFCNSTIYTNDIQMGSTIYFAYGTGQQWGTNLNGSGEYVIQDDVGDTRLKLSKTTGLTISTLNVTAVPSATPTLALGVDGSGGVVSYALPVPYTGATSTVNLGSQNIFANTARFTGIASATPSLALGVDGSGNLNSFPVPSATNLLPLNNTWTGTNTFNDTVSTLATTTVSSKAYLTQSLRTAGMSAMAVNPGIITGGAPWLLTPSPASSPLASCYSPTQIWITGARYIFRFANFSYGIFGMTLTFFQANVADTGAVPISATFPFVTGDFTGIFTPNINSSFLGQVYLQFQGTANKTFNWTSFTYEVGTLEIVGELEMNGIANIHAGNSSAVLNNFMSAGSLTIGDITKNYGGGTTTWNASTAGLLMECLDNTEIAIHDAGARVASFMYYTGGTNTFTMGRNMGWGVSDVATASKLTVQDVVRFGNYSGGNYDNIQFMRGTGTGQYPNIRCQNNYIAMYVSDVGGWVPASQVGDMVFLGEAGRNLRFGVGSQALQINSSNDIIASGNVTVGCLVVTGVGTYQPGCIYSDANWGMLFRARLVPTAQGGIFSWYDSAGNEKMKMLPNGQLQLTTVDGPGFVHTNGTVIVESYIGGSGGWFGTRTNHPLRFYTNNSTTRMSVNIDGTVNVATRLAIGGVNSNGVLDIVNPNGIYTHFGWTDNHNYIRGVATIMDCHVTLNTSGSAGGTPRIQSGNGNRSMRYDDGNLVTWLLNNSGSVPIPWTHSSWGAGSGGGYTVIARSEGINEMGLGFGVSNYRSVIISLAPAVIWGEIILSGGTIYTSCNGTINLYTAGGGWIYISDKRCKKDIKDIKTTRSLERIMALKPKTYKKIYPENPETPISDKVRDADHIGFLAQDVMESNPHCVDEWVDDKSVCDGDDGTRLGIAYGDINVHMVGAIQELKKQNDRQQEQIEDLRQYKILSDERFEKMGRLIGDQQKLLEFLMSKLK